jgi:adenylate cyclase
VVLWSAASVTSEWVLDEAAHARDRNRLVPVAVAHVTPPIGFRQRHVLDLSAWSGDPGHAGFVEMIASVRRLLAWAESSAPDVDGPRRTPPQLAVLPFEAPANDEDTSLLADGLAEEILLALGRARGIRLVGRTSSFQMRGARKAEASSALNATHLLDGTVRRVGTALQVVAQLTDAATGSMLWSNRYSYDQSNVLALQDTITSEIATTLQFMLADRPASRRLDAGAYDFYIRGRRLSRLHNAEACNQAVHCLEAATRGTPQYARAWAALAAARAETLSFVELDAQAPIVFAVRESAARALSMDNTLGEAYAAQVLCLPDIGAWRQKQELLDAGLQADPNDALLLARRALFRVSVGFIRGAVLDHALAFEIDPLSPQAHLGKGIALWLQDRVGESDALFRRARASWPEHILLWFYHYWVLLNSERVEEAERHLESRRPATVDDRWTQIQLSITRALRGAPLAVDHLLKEIGRPGTVVVSRYGLQIGPVLARVGYFDKAFAVLDSCLGPPWRSHVWGPAPFRVRPGAATAALFSPASRELRSDRRFATLCGRLGLGSFWTECNTWPDCAAEVRGTYAFDSQCSSVASQVPELP